MVWNNRRSKQWQDGEGWTHKAAAGVKRGNWWTCQVPECKASLKKIGRQPWYNAREATECGHCGLPWQALQACKHSSLLQAQKEVQAAVEARGAANVQPDQPSLSKTQARRQRAKKAAEQLKADGDKAVAPKPAAADPLPAKADMDCDAEKKKEDAGAVEDDLMSKENMKELHEKLKNPSALKEGWSPSQVVDSSSDDASAAEALEALRDELCDCEALLELANPGKLGLDVNVTKARKAELERLIRKTDRDTPGAGPAEAAVTTAELELQKALYLKDSKDKQAFANRGAEKARQAFVTLQLAQRKHAEYWQQQLQDTAESELTRQQEWSVRNEVHAQRHKQVLQEFDKRIAANKAEAPAQSASPPEPATSWRQKPCFFETVAFEYDQDLLPQMTEEDFARPGALATCGNLYQLLAQWLQAGASIYFTFQQLASVSAAGADTKELILTLLGDQKELWFQESPAAETDLIPRQAVIAVYHVLEVAKLRYDGLEAMKASASAALGQLNDQHKKRRIAV